MIDLIFNHIFFVDTMRNDTDEEAGCSPAKKRERDAVAEEPLRRVKTEGKQFLTIFIFKKRKL